MIKIREETTGETKILIVDDEPGIRFLVKEVLQQIGRKIYLAASGQQGMDLLNQEEIDIILLDLELSDMSGLEVLKKLQEKNFTGKVIMMTAHISGEKIERATNLGVKNFLFKPFDIQELKEMVEN